MRTADPDFREVFRVMPGCHILLDLELGIVDASDAYLAATETVRERIVGRQLFDVFPDNPADAEADGVANLGASLARARTTGRPDRMPIQKYDVRRGDGTGFEVRYWSPVNTPVFGPDGTLRFLLHTVEDVTTVVHLGERGREQADAIEELARRSAERCVDLLDTAPDAMVVIDANARITLVNRQTEQLFGYHRAELVGQPLDTLIPERFRHGHAGHLSRFAGTPRARPMGTGLELWGRRRDGSEVAIEVSLSPLGEGEDMTISAAIRDISERKRLERVARVNAERLASAVESVDDGFALFDHDHKLVMCNAAYRRLLVDGEAPSILGMRYEALLESWMRRHLTFEDPVAAERFRAERLDQWTTPSTVELTTRSGTKLRVRDRTTPEGGLVETVTDLTEDEARAQELREARIAAEKASAAKSEFLASMSHELRTPMNAVLGFAQLLLRDKRTPLTPHHLARVEQILRGGEHLLHLIDDVLDLSRIEVGGITISTEPVLVSELLREVIATLEPMAIRQEISLRIDNVAPDLTVLADRTRLAQIVMNLASNAIKYNRPGGHVRLAVHAVGGRIRVAVEDDGIGIPTEQQLRLFQPFQRAGQETGPIEGTGIGLVITKRLAELMDGAVGFTSEANRGSTFWVELPEHSAPPASVRRLGLRAAAESRPGGEKHLVLYIEDNPANVRFMRDLLESFEDIELVSVPTAELGIDLARARRPALVVLDINLPGMNGVEAMRVLRRTPETAGVPVVALTAAASRRERERGLEAGFDRYLTKPVQVDEFETAIGELLGRATA